MTRKLKNCVGLSVGEGIRTPGLGDVNAALYQLSYPNSQLKTFHLVDSIQQNSSDVSVGVPILQSERRELMIFKFPNRIRAISTPRLNTLLCLHLAPINLVISQGSHSASTADTIPNLGVGFILRCFQNLSIPDIATLRCPWQDSRHTSGQFTPVLSSRNSPVTRSADYIFILLRSS